MASISVIFIFETSQDEYPQFPFILAA